MRKEDIKFGTVLTVRKDLIDNEIYGEVGYCENNMGYLKGKKVTVKHVGVLSLTIEHENDVGYSWSWEMMEESRQLSIKENLTDEEYIVLCTLPKAISRYYEKKEAKLLLNRNLKELRKESIKVRTQIENEIYQLTTQLSYLNNWIDKIDED